MSSQEKKKKGGKGPPPKTLYEILEVAKDATPEQIRSTYKKMAVKFHPDKNPHGGEYFKEIVRAYEILSNPEKRRVYDVHGEDGLRMQEHLHFQPTFDTPHWRETLIIWLIVLYLDYLFSFPLEWLLGLGVSGFFIYAADTPKIYTIPGYLVGVTVLYFITPYLSFLATLLLYSIIILINGGMTSYLEIPLGVLGAMMTVHWWMIGFPTLYGFSGWITVNGLLVSILGILIIAAHTTFDIQGSYCVPPIMAYAIKILGEGRGLSVGLAIEAAAVICGYIFNVPIDQVLPAFLSLQLLVNIPIIVVMGFVIAFVLMYLYLPFSIVYWFATLTFGVLLMNLTHNVYKIPEELKKQEKGEEEGSEDNEDEEDEDDKVEPLWEEAKKYPKECWALFVLWVLLDRFWRTPPERFVFLYYMGAAIGIFSLFARILVMILKPQEMDQKGQEEKQEAEVQELQKKDQKQQNSKKTKT